MGIERARRVVRLTKEDSPKEVLVTMWEGGRLSSCVVDEGVRQSCQACEGDDALCSEWLDYLKQRGYTATEVELGDGETEESLPRFLEGRGTEPLMLEER